MMIDRIERQDSVVNRIVEGSITIDSVEEFEDLLKAFPNDPKLHRVFADLLTEKKAINAPDAYNTAATLFLESGMPLQAIACKIIEWSINEPSEVEKRAFHFNICECNAKNFDSQTFFTKLAPDELFDIIENSVLNSYKQNTRLKKFGDEENEICFIVSGSLEKTHFHRPDIDGKIQKKTTSNLIESDLFGHIFPFNEDILSESQIESITRTELLKISKLNLMALCNEHHNLGAQVQNLYESFFNVNREINSKTIRKACALTLWSASLRVWSCLM